MIKRFLRWAALGFLLLVAAVLLGRNLLIKQGARAALKAALGLALAIDSLDVGLFRSTIRIEGLAVSNPAGFGDAPLARVPLIFVDYDLGSLLGGKPHFRAIEVDVAEVSVVKNAGGELNLNRIRAVASKGGEKPQEASKPVEMRIDRLTLTIGKVRYLELDGAGATRKESDFQVGVDHEVFEDLRGPDEVVRLVVLRTVKAAGLKGLGLCMENLASAGLEHVKGKGMEALDAVGEGLKNGAGKVGDAARGLFDGLRKQLKD